MAPCFRKYMLSTFFFKLATANPDVITHFHRHHCVHTENGLAPAMDDISITVRHKSC